MAKQDTIRKKFLESAESQLRNGITPRVWAFAMVVSVNKLKQITDDLGGALSPLFNILDPYIKTALDVWKQRGTREEPADEDNNQPATKKRKTASTATSRLTSEAVSEATSVAASEETQQVTEQRSGVRDQKLTAHVRHNITDFCLLRKLIQASA